MENSNGEEYFSLFYNQKYERKIFKRSELIKNDKKFYIRMMTQYTLHYAVKEKHLKHQKLSKMYSS